MNNAYFQLFDSIVKPIARSKQPMGFIYGDYINFNGICYKSDLIYTKLLVYRRFMTTLA